MEEKKKKKKKKKKRANARPLFLQGEEKKKNARFK